jgi:hypothetical protein
MVIILLGYVPSQVVDILLLVNRVVQNIPFWLQEVWRLVYFEDRLFEDSDHERNEEWGTTGSLDHDKQV